MWAFCQRRFSQMNLKKGENNKLFQPQIRRKELEVSKKIYYKEEVGKQIIHKRRNKKEKKLQNRIRETTHAFKNSHMVLLTILKL